MFHTYVLNLYAIPIDIDRPRFLAVDDLWNEVAWACDKEGEKDPQILWDRHCAEHGKRYGEPFPPQVRRERF